MGLWAMSLRIRPETPLDACVIEAVTIAAFAQAPHTNHTEQHIVRALRQAAQLTLSLVAEEAGTVIGHAALSPVQISDGARDWYGLGPISVLPNRQRCGVGTQLMRHVLGDLHLLGAAGCVVLGEPAYYGRFGFSVQPALVLPGVPAEFFQVLPFKGPLPKGVVTYHPAFSATA